VLKSDRFGMEILTFDKSTVDNGSLKSDRFGMEILYYIIGLLSMMLNLVKIRPFRYGNYILYTLIY